jgi:hypothetical protein
VNAHIVIVQSAHMFFEARPDLQILHARARAPDWRRNAIRRRIGGLFVCPADRERFQQQTVVAVIELVTLCSKIRYNGTASPEAEEASSPVWGTTTGEFEPPPPQATNSAISAMGSQYVDPTRSRIFDFPQFERGERYRARRLC